jgi:hypothetical protein
LNDKDVPMHRHVHCGRPACPNTFQPRTGPGRPRIYCSDQCRWSARRDPGYREANSLAEPTAPFPAAVRSAIRASGLTLQQITNRLVRQGHRISGPTLSGWQNGANLPPPSPEGRSRVLALERVLGLPPTTLVEPWHRQRPEVPPPRPTALTARPHPGGLAGRRVLLEEAIAHHGGALSRQSLVLTWQEEHYMVGADRWPLRSRIVLEAYPLRPGIDRYWLPYSYHRDESAADVVPADGCDLGVTIREDEYAPATRDPEPLAATELVFDRPLALGRPHRFSFTITHSYQPETVRLPRREFRRLIGGPACRALVLSISFHRVEPPAQLRVCTWNRPHDEAPSQYTERSNTHTDVLTLTNPPPGGYGWQWDWPAHDQPGRRPLAAVR